MNSIFTRHVSALLFPVMLSQVALGAGCAADATGSDPSNSAPSSAERHVGYDGHTLFQAIFFNSGPAAQQIRDLWADARPSYATKRTPEELAKLLDQSADTMEAEHIAEAHVAHVREVAAKVRSEKLKLDDLRLSQERTSAVVEALMAQIEANDPAFFATFADHIQSGNPVRVQTALTEAGHHLFAAHSSLIALPPASTIGSLPGTTIGSLPSKQPIAPGTPKPGPNLPGPSNQDDLVVVDVAVAVETVAAVAIAVVAVAVAFAGKAPGGVTVQASPLQRDEVTSALARAYAL